MTIGTRVLALGWVLLVTAHCASAPRTLSERFITRGTPAVDLGGPRVVLPGADSREGPSEAVNRLPVPAAGPTQAPTRAPAAALLESSSPGLRRALGALAVAPTSAHHLDVAQAYLAEGVHDRAFDYLAAGLARDGRSAPLHDATAQLWRDWGQLDRALHSAHAAVYYAPRSAAARTTLGTILWALDQPAEARAAFAEATELAPDAWYTWHNRCAAEGAAGPSDAARVHCERAARLKARTKGTRP